MRTDAQRASDRETYDRLRAAGLCVKCAKPSDGMQMCQDHRTKLADRRVSNIRYRLVAEAKYRAAKLHIPFDLATDDIEVPTVCPVLGKPMAVNIGKRGPGPFSPTLDKIIPARGYVRGNVQVISRRANQMKNDASPEELRTFAEWVMRNV